jgi:DNA topoisomerase-1
VFDLIVIESPNKAKKISGYAGGVRVVATVGHFLDLPVKDLAVDLVTLEPRFEVTERGRKVVPEIRKAAAGKRVCVATDPDREGYAIGHHVWEEVRKGAKSVFRAEIREITAKGVASALAAAVPFEETNTHQYDAFLGRRVADRLVGYLLSPAASRTLGRGFSVGRVQSPAVRLVVERERAIRAFVPEPYWLLEATLAKGDATFKALHAGGPFKELAAAQAVLAKVEPAPIATVTSVEEKVARQSPRPPFTTSDLLATASAKLRIPPERTMKLAQELFENALITYHRTDSVRLADDFISEARSWIGSAFGADFVPDGHRRHRSKGSQAEAHEAIRPTALRPVSEWGRAVAAERLTEEHARLYDLVCRRTLASQMADALFDSVTILLDIASEPFKAKGRTPRFAGFLALYGEDEERKAQKETDGGTPGAGEDEEEQGTLPRVEKGEEVEKTGAELVGKETRPPGRYSEGTLVKALEKLGIGRPSTWSTIVRTVKDREYVSLAKGKLVPTDRGERIVDFLAERFEWVVDYAMTRRMEERLDEVEEKGADWKAFAREVASRCPADAGPRRSRSGGAEGDGAKAAPRKAAAGKSPSGKGRAGKVGAGKGGARSSSAGGESAGNGASVDSPAAPIGGDGPTEKQLSFARDLSERHGEAIPEEALSSKRLIGKWIDEILAAHPKGKGKGAPKGRGRGGSPPSAGGAGRGRGKGKGPATAARRPRGGKGAPPSDGAGTGGAAAGAPSGRPLSPKQLNVIRLFAPPEVQAKVAAGDASAGRAFLDLHFGK